MLKKNIVRLLLVTVLMATTLAVLPRPAHASKVCDWKISCGLVWNDSSHDLIIGGGIKQGDPVFYFTLHPGERSTRYLADTDYVISPTTMLQIGFTTVGPQQSIKINDLQMIRCWDDTSIWGTAMVRCAQ
jgi:hypothetical protein